MKKGVPEAPMQFRQLFDRSSCTYTYLLADKGEAVLIDPVKELFERDAQLIEELGLRLLATLETHVHADHVTGAARFRTRFGSAVMVSSTAGVDGADRTLAHLDVVRFGERSLQVRHTPGHTSGCASFVLDDESMAFTGDALLIRGSGRTDFQGGSAATLYASVREQLLSLPATTRLYPGHDYKGRTVTTVAEERSHNPRLGDDVTQGRFEHIMANLGLAHPKHIARALPANRALGVEPSDAWEGLERDEQGVVQVSVDWVREHPGLTLVDVREPDEWVALPPLPGARTISLGSLADALESLCPRTPTVVICRSGRRSERGALQLEAAGFAHVASMTGGMLAVETAQVQPERC